MPPGGTVRRSVSTFEALEAGIDRQQLARLRSISPDPASSTIASATSATTRTASAERADERALAIGVAFLHRVREDAASCANAGTRPNSSPTASAIAKVKASAVQSR